MSAAIRILVILTLVLATTPGLFAQETTATPATATTTTTSTAAATGTSGAGDAVETTTTATDTTGAQSAIPAHDVERTRNELHEVLSIYSNDMSTILALEPSLLSNEEFLQGHPDLAAFVARHPEVSQHPSFYLRGVEVRTGSRSAFGEALESIIIFGIFVFIAAVLAWFVRTVIEQKRWSRLTQQQAEVHNKILDRFGNTEELLQYIKTPAGTKFLESAPIPLHTERTKPAAPHSRVLLSIQIGVVVAAGALGMILVSFRFDRDTAADLFALGTIGFCVGLGFIASALISMFLARKLETGEPGSVELVK